jgi:LysM repeat protein
MAVIASNKSNFHSNLTKIMHKSILTGLYMLIISVTAFAQAPTDRVVQIYQGIIVLPGETLYSLSKDFNVSTDAIRKANPWIGEEGLLKAGQEILIPTLGMQKTAGVILPKTKTEEGNKSEPTQTSTINLNPFDNPQSTPTTAEADLKKKMNDALKNANKPPVAGPGPSAPANKPTNPASTSKSPEIVPIVIPAPKNGNVIIHTVEKGQTLYSISRMYGVKPADVLLWNNLSNETIALGSKLNIYTSTETAPVKAQEPVNTTESLPVNTPEPVKPAETTVVKPVVETAPLNSQQETLYNTFQEAKSSGALPVNQRVTIGWIASDNPKPTVSYICLHKTAPVGTIIRLSNLVNKKVAYVKVIGKVARNS